METVSVYLDDVRSLETREKTSRSGRRERARMEGWFLRLAGADVGIFIPLGGKSGQRVGRESVRFYGDGWI